MASLVDLSVPQRAAAEPLGPRLARALGWAPAAVGPWRVVRRSLDARKGRPLGYRLRVAVARAGEAPPEAITARRSPSSWPASGPPPRVAGVGSGPHRR